MALARAWRVGESLSPRPARFAEAPPPQPSPAKSGRGSALPPPAQLDPVSSAWNAPKLSFGYGARKNAAGGGKSIPSTSSFCGSTPTPALPREVRERERTAVAGPTRPHLICLERAEAELRLWRSQERGGWGQVYPLEQRVLRKHPPPQPSPAKCGRGSALPSPAQLDLISSA